MAADLSHSGMPHFGTQTEAVDHAVLEQLRIDLEDDDGTAVAGVVSIYLASAETLLPDLAAALQAGDAAAAARFAHALASPSVLVGAGTLGMLLQRVQDSAHDSGIQPAERAALAETIRSEGHRVVTSLAQLDLASQI